MHDRIIVQIYLRFRATANARETSFTSRRNRLVSGGGSDAAACFFLVARTPNDDSNFRCATRLLKALTTSAMTSAVDRLTGEAFSVTLNGSVMA